MTSLRAAIAQAVAAHSAAPPPTSQRRTPSGVPIPPNPSGSRRPPPRIDYSDPAIARELPAPGFQQRLKQAVQAGVISPQGVKDLLTDLRQHRRALNGDRQLPGEYLGDDSLPYLSMPYAPKETFLPGREPGTAAYNVLRTTIDQLDASELTEGLADKLHTREKVAQIERAEDAAPPSLRESVEAAASLHYPQEN
jgi:hypothetical protein